MSEKDVIKETRPRMETVIDDFQRKLATVRTGRAAVSLLDSVMVDYYGTMTPLNQMASVHAPEPAMLTVQPWDQTQVAPIEKAIRAADLGRQRVLLFRLAPPVFDPTAARSTWPARERGLRPSDSAASSSRSNRPLPNQAGSLPRGPCARSPASVGNRR